MLLRVDARSVIYAQVVGVASTADAVSKTLSVIPSESPALQWALHVRDRTVAEDAVTSFGHKYMAARSSSFCRPFWSSNQMHTAQKRRF